MVRLSAQARQGGFTLVELMLVVAIVALLAGLAAPAFSTLVERQRIRTETTRLQLSFFQARSEAIKRSRRVIMCPLLEPAPETGVGGFEPECGGIYESGWMLFVDLDNDRLKGADEPLLKLEPAPIGVSITNRKGTRKANERMVFRPDGSARRALTLLVCSLAQPQLESRGLVVNRIGRPRIARGWGTCPEVAEVT
jgi:type IV fimbrial biogenesis protein FimT